MHWKARRSDEEMGVSLYLRIPRTHPCYGPPLLSDTESPRTRVRLPPRFEIRHLTHSTSDPKTTHRHVKQWKTLLIFIPLPAAHPSNRHPPANNIIRHLIRMPRHTAVYIPQGLAPSHFSLRACWMSPHVPAHAYVSSPQRPLD